MTVIRWNPLKEIDDLFARAGQFPPLAQNPGQTRNQTLGRTEPQALRRSRMYSRPRQTT